MICLNYFYVFLGDKYYYNTVTNKSLTATQFRLQINHYLILHTRI